MNKFYRFNCITTNICGPNNWAECDIRGLRTDYILAQNMMENLNTIFDISLSYQDIES